MTPSQVALIWAGLVGIVAILCGLRVRRRLHLCVGFALYLLAVVVTESLALVDPDRFHKAWFYIWKEAVLNLLKLAAGAELAWRVFRGFPGAWWRARFVLAPLLALTTLALVTLPRGSTAHDLVFGYQAQVNTGAIWLLACTAVLAAWFHLPLHAVHRAILAGLGGYLALSAALLEWMRVGGLYDDPNARVAIGLVNSAAYSLMLGWIAVAAWQPSEVAVRMLPPALLARLKLDPA